MNKDELEMYRNRLLKLRDSITKDMKHIQDDFLHSPWREATGDLSAYSQHTADIASDSYGQEIDAALLSGESDLVYEINEAIYRIEKGNFGLCVECGKEISRERLDAMPYARLCIECKKKEEPKRDREKNL
ncbi:MAG: TraR/DksA C4-type zinc finger protein [bacterium]|nr:TraR/DksA C4-type zinc finger protein [bacterium]